MDPLTVAQIGSTVLSGLGALQNRNKSPQLDLGALRKSAKDNGFNPLTVLRMTGGQGFMSSVSPSALSILGEMGSNISNAFVSSQQRQQDKKESDARIDLMAAQSAAFTSPPVASVSGYSGAARPPVNTSETISRVFTPLTPSMPSEPEIEVDPFRLTQTVTTQPQLTDSGAIVDLPIGPDFDEILTGYLINRTGEISVIRENYNRDPIGTLSSLNDTYSPTPHGPLINGIMWMMGEFPTLSTR